MSKIGLGLLTVLVLAVIGCENKEITMDNGLIIEDIIIGCLLYTSDAADE